ncbi:MAG: hypothetical protein ABIH28_04015 [archaeon]
MELSDQLEGMSLKEKGKLLTKMWKKVDWASCVRQIEWNLSVPKCICEGCNPVYQNWLDAGKELYKESPEAYEKIVAEENARREERKLSRALDNKKYARSVLRNVSVFN